MTGRIEIAVTRRTRVLSFLEARPFVIEADRMVHNRFEKLNRTSYETSMKYGIARRAMLAARSAKDAKAKG